MKRIFVILLVAVFFVGFGAGYFMPVPTVEASHCTSGDVDCDVACDVYCKSLNPEFIGVCPGASGHCCRCLA